MFAAAGLLSGCTKELTLNESVGGKSAGRTVLSIALPEGLKTSLSERIEAVPHDFYRLYWSNGDALLVNGVSSEGLSEIAAQSRCAKFTFNETLAAPYKILYPCI